jgi:GNAT superfamily N-acetyltransferase
VELRIANVLTDDEHRQLFGWGEDIFGMANQGLHWRPKDHHVFVEVGGRAVSHVGLLRHTVKVGGAPVEVGGIGGVVTMPDMQGRGHARQALRYASSLMCREWGLNFGLLFCREALTPFYRELGWRRVEEPVMIEQPSGRIGSPVVVMVLSCGDQGWPAGVVDLGSFPW